MNYQVPGIYSSHQIAFPPLSGRLEPGIPAILGYTEKAEVAKGVSLAFVPTLLNTWEAFIAQFGGPFPIKANVGYDPQGRIHVARLIERRFLWESVRLFFENGGRDIYIVSIGDYNATPNRADFEAGLEALRAYDVPSHVLMPDSVLLGVVDCGNLQAYTLQHCADHKHRFAILDLVELHSVEATIDSFRSNLNSPRLDLGAAYYPWIRTGYKLEILPKNITYSQIVYREPKEVEMELMQTREMGMQKLEAVTEVFVERKREAYAEVEVETITETEVDWEEVIANTVMLQSGKFEEALTKEIFTPLSRQWDVKVKHLGAATVKSQAQFLSNYLGFGRSIVLGLSSLALKPGFPPELAAFVEKQRKYKPIRNAIAVIVANELDPNVAAAINRKGRAEEDFKGLAKGKPTWMDAWPGATATTEAPITKGKPPIEEQVKEATLLPPRQMEPVPTSPTKSLKEVASQVTADQVLHDAIATLVKGYNALFDLATELQKRPPKPDPVPDSVKAGALLRLSGMTAWLPPSGAVAGLYATTDRERGTFKAPANASLRAVLDVGHRLTLPQQEDMNASPTGKAVNALLIRPGRGIIVNASRTCDAHSREWRYVPVRRYFLAVEKAVLDRMIDYVFHTNDANLWENVRGMLTGFCLQQFKSGALAGKNADEAFFVQVGQGETMTDTDILEGRLIVQIGLAVARPAEFIVLTFVHHMESDRMSIQS